MSTLNLPLLVWNHFPLSWQLSLLKSLSPSNSPPLGTARPLLSLLGAFSSVRVHRWLMSSLPSTRTRKSFSAGLSWAPYIPQLVLIAWVPKTQVQDLPLALLNFMMFFWALYSSLSKSLWMAFHPSGILSMNYTKLGKDLTVFIAIFICVLYCSLSVILLMSILTARLSYCQFIVLLITQ